MTADVEDDYIVAQANEPLDEKRVFPPRQGHGRRDEFVEVDRERWTIWTFLPGWWSPWPPP